MLERLSEQSALCLLRRLPDRHDKKAVYCYGFALFYSSCLIIISILTVSCLLQSIWYGICFLAVFIPLRSYTGGYHCESYTGCFFISNLIFLFTYWTAEFLLTRVSSVLWISVTFLASVYICKNSPVGHKNHPINEELLPLYQLKACLLTAFFLVLLIALQLTGCMEACARTASATLNSVALLIYIALKKGEKNDCKNLRKVPGNLI